MFDRVSSEMHLAPWKNCLMPRQYRRDSGNAYGSVGISVSFDMAETSSAAIDWKWLVIETSAIGGSRKGAEEVAAGAMCVCMRVLVLVRVRETVGRGA